MDFLLRLMGSVAKCSYESSRSRTRGVKSNWAAIVFLMAGVAYCAILVIYDQNLFAGALALVMLVAAVAILVSVSVKDTFFTAGPLPTNVALVNGDAAFETRFKWTGRMELSQTHMRYFVYVPASATRMKDGTFAVVSKIDASSKMYGVVVSNRNGLWVVVPRPGTFQIETGTQYYGFRGYPALRMHFVDDSDRTNSTALLTFDSPEERKRVYAWLLNENQKAGKQS